MIKKTYICTKSVRLIERDTAHNSGMEIYTQGMEYLVIDDLITDNHGDKRPVSTRWFGNHFELKTEKQPVITKNQNIAFIAVLITFVIVVVSILVGDIINQPRARKTPNKPMFDEGVMMNHSEIIKTK